MLSKKRGVRIHQMASQMTVREEDLFLMDLQLDAETERPRLVLDCSKIVSMNRGDIRLLLACLEIAMKCNGDVRLASLSPAAEATLQSTGVIRLFETYPTLESAVHSYHRRPYSMAGVAAHSDSMDRALEYAA